MISYEEAKAKALKLKSNVNGCYDAGDAYIFYNNLERLQIGCDSVVIVKESGDAINMTGYSEMSRNPDIEEVGDIDF